MVAFPIGATAEQTPPEQATSEGGTYSLVGLPPGSYDVEFAPGCGGAQNLVPQWWQDASSRASATPVTVSAGATTTGIDATLASG